MSFSNVDPADMPAVDTSTRAQIGAQLQETLVELIDLHLTGKHMHWNVTGPSFITVHRLLDEFIEVWYDAADTVAERAIQLGYSVDGQAKTVSAVSDFIASGPLDDEDVVRMTTDRIKAQADQIRTRIKAMSSEDIISQNILIGINQDLEKQLWFIRVQLGDQDNDEDDADEDATPVPPRRDRRPQWELSRPRRFR